MKSFSIASVSLVIALVPACTNHETPSSLTASVVPSSLDVATSQIQSIVAVTQEFDEYSDGIVDSRGVFTTWYDQRGNPVKEVSESSGYGSTGRGTTVHQYSARGIELGWVSESDQGADGTIEVRTTVATVETDNRGNPIKQVVTSNQNGLTFTNYITQEFDSRGRVIRLVRVPEKWTYSYDSHDNIVGAVLEITGGSRTFALRYNVHGALVYSETVARVGGSVASTTTLSTAEFDKQGYPIRQLIEGPNFGSVVHHTARTLTYDAHHQLLKQTDEIDDDADSRDDRAVTTWEYSGRGLETPAHQSAALAIRQTVDNLEASGPDLGRLADGTKLPGLGR